MKRWKRWQKVYREPLGKHLGYYVRNVRFWLEFIGFGQCRPFLRNREGEAKPQRNLLNVLSGTLARNYILLVDMLK